MTDKQPADDLAPEQSAATDNEVDLLADFRDLLGDEDEPAVEPAKPAGDDDDLNLQELEAFLDDFNHDGSDEDEPEAAAVAEEEPAAATWDEEPQLYSAEDFAADDEAAPEEAVDLAGQAPIEASPGAGDEPAEPPLTLDAAELDLAPEEGVAPPADAGFEQIDLDAMAAVGETMQEADAEPEPEAGPVAFAADDAEGPPDDFEPMGGMPVAPPPQAAAPAAGAGDQRRFLIAAAVAGVGLLLALVVGVMAMGLGSEVERLNETLAGLQARTASGAPTDDARIEQALRETQRLGARLSELAIIIEGPMSHLREMSERDIHHLSARLDSIEATLGDLKNARTAAPVKKAPVLVKAQAGKTEKPAPAAAEGAWVVNLVSLSEAAAAEQEQARLRRFGIETVRQQVTVDGRTWYRLRVTGFESREAAQAYLDKASARARLGGAWVTRG